MRSIALAALLALALPAASQETNDYGSVYSRFGLGERAEFSTSQSAMLGGAAVALRSPTAAALANPALAADLGLTTFALAAEFRGVAAENADAETARSAGGGLGGLTVGLPLLPGRLGLALAFRPYTRVNYRAVAEDSLQRDEGGDYVPFRVNFEGAGGLNQLSAGLGARVSSGVRVGAGVEWVFGRVEYLQRTEFLEDAAFQEVRLAQSTRLSGVSGTLGAHATLPLGRPRIEGSAEGRPSLSVGAALTLPMRLGGTRARTLGSSLDQDTLRTEEEGNVTLPLALRAGLAYTSGARWTLAADALYEPWADFESDLAFGGFDAGGGLDELRDRLRVGGGVQVTPAGNDRLRGFFARTAYRLGAYAERAYVAPTDQDLTTLALTGGFSFPTVFPAARLDLGLEAGTRGSTEGLLVREQFFRTSLTVNFGERWFLRRRLG